jgi:hypothetical protein
LSLSLIWHPRATGVIIFGPAVLSGELLARFWEGRMDESRYEIREQERGWSGRQIERWESTHGRNWEGRRWPRQS